MGGGSPQVSPNKKGVAEGSLAREKQGTKAETKRKHYEKRVPGINPGLGSLVKIP